MRATPRYTRFALLTILGLGMLAARADDDPFHRLRRLEGTWLAVDDKGRVTGQVASVFRVTANGHTVQEIMFPGTANEMVNMYYRDVDHVLVTHYCAGGNQPTMRVVPTPDPDVLQLEFDDITNMVTIDDEHMHEGSIRWLGEDRLKTEWRSFRSGRLFSTATFEMVRQQ
ncbi:MAG: hypothetical protein IT486_08265 [Gammaproteobacteria bacterium]|nr:hypothetical protein [Gammaproteobacteria bacterium]